MSFAQSAGEGDAKTIAFSPDATLLLVAEEGKLYVRDVAPHGTLCTTIEESGGAPTVGILKGTVERFLPVPVCSKP